ncbi:amino acid adenylation domain-containing protein [Streptomyces hydrogenans]|uniref:amino acid adenylation domain-containing protein n=1 Tax=Streptomyces hydrogenans TaxID=1873719 RepID=UPI003630718F
MAAPLAPSPSAPPGHDTGSLTVRALSCPATDDPVAVAAALAALLHRYTGDDLTAVVRDPDGRALTAAPLRADARLLHAGLAEILAKPEAYAATAAPEPAGTPADGAPAARPDETAEPGLTVTVETAAAAAAGSATRPGPELGAVPEPVGLVVTLESGLPSLTDGIVRAVREHGARFVAAALHAPDVPLKDLPGADPHTHGHAPGTGAATPDVPIHALVEPHAAEGADRIAVRCGDEALTYGELWARATRVAAGLGRAGVGPGALVGVLAERGVAAVVHLLASSMAGACAVPLDPGYPDARLALMTGDPRLVAVVAAPEHAHRVPGNVPTLPADDLDRPSSPELRPGPDAPGPGTTSAGPDGDGDRGHRLATLMYTSGSTGAPKGVEITHRGIVRLVRDERIAFRPDDVVLHCAPLAFDASLLEIWGALARGAVLEIAPPGPLSLSELAEVVRERGITALWLTAGLFHQLAEYEPDCLERVRLLLTGGDVVSPHHVRAVLTRWPGLAVVNGYGPTENTTFTTCHVLADPAGAADASLPIGRAVAGTGVHLLDAYGNPVPPGVPGELWTSGDGLARGYAGRPDLTAERFTTPDRGPLQGVRMYRTGDLATLRDDGALDFLGRRDLQVKVNGYRIELAEIEAAVLAHPDVRQVCVVVEPDAFGGKRLSAHVVAGADAARLTRELRLALRSRLPAFMVPARWTVVDSLPLTANGKTDRGRLTAAPALQKD